MTNQSFLVAAIGTKKAALIQVFAKDEQRAVAAVEAVFIDTYGECAKARCIDTGATVGSWIVGDPSYIQGVVVH